MAWYSYTLALPVEVSLASSLNAHSDLTGYYSEDCFFVHTSSRNGAMLGLLSEILQEDQSQAESYLLKDFVKLEGQAIEQARTDIACLLERIQQDPARVSEATKTSYMPYLTLHSAEFEPIEAEYVYPSDALIRDGFYYRYPPSQVLQALANAQVSSNPNLPHDPDGESLEYLFTFLKSHLWLLQNTDPAKEVLIYGELNL